MKRIILVLIVLGLILIPVTVDANIPEPTCWPPEEWREEYCEWVVWQQELQRQFTNETGYGLGALLTFSQWAEMKAVNEPYWWVSEPIEVPCWRGYSYLFCDSNGKRVAKSWGWSKI